jgi:S-DNA-T family DNA segregation ATPase FtsK/SpoIIIE
MALTQDQAATILALTLKLNALKLTGTFGAIEPGPIVTTYYYKLASDIPIAKILKAEEDLALAVDVPSVLITRIGGQIAIAIPNKIKETVSYDRCFDNLMRSNYRLPIILGVSTTGEPALLELVESPHILMAGSTGAGKSVLLSAIISGLVSFNSPAQMKLLLVDTKQLDLTLFNTLPHVADVADTVEKTHQLFERLMQIVRQRTLKMKGIARNVTEYNALQPTSHKLPYYVVIIDELADVINEDANLANAGVEPFTSYPRISRRLQNLVQISRAAGVHVICATQRPSVKIITGDIKANFATRIALRLPTGHDSKTIINEYGAEKLLGKGDMLVESPTGDQITRYHGPFVSMDHIANVLINCEHIRDTYKAMQEV